MHCSLPYSRKYWWELNLAFGSQIAIAKVLVDLNLVVWYGIAIRIYASKKFWLILNLAVSRADRQTAKFNSPPNFPAIRYINLNCPHSLTERSDLKLFKHSCVGVCTQSQLSQVNGPKRVGSGKTKMST